MIVVQVTMIISDLDHEHDDYDDTMIDYNDHRDDENDKVFRYLGRISLFKLILSTANLLRKGGGLFQTTYYEIGWHCCSKTFLDLTILLV